MKWITDRNPRETELQMTPPGAHSTHGDFFLVWDGEVVDIDFFEMSSRNDTEPAGQASGFWHRPGVLAWCPLPPPPVEL